MRKGVKVLVSGGAGFIGSWLCQALHQEGYKVICLDNLSSGSKENLIGLPVLFLEKDICQPVDLEVDYIFQLASRASPADFAPYGVDILCSNSQGTFQLLELARRCGARFVLASSSEVYGNPAVHPQTEDYWGHVNPRGPRSCYDEAKRFAEALTMAYHRQYKLDVRIARIFNTYGERMRLDDGRVIPNFLCQALKGALITVYGDGSQTRSLCYIEDLVAGLMKLMFLDNLDGEVFNLGNPQEVKILDLAKKVKSLTGSASSIVFQPLPIDDPLRRKPDINRAVNKLGWQPKTSLDEGLERTIQYFKKMLT